MGKDCYTNSQMLKTILELVKNITSPVFHLIIGSLEKYRVMVFFKLIF